MNEIEPVNSYSSGKIMDYGLDELVTKLYIEGFNHSRIAKECNKFINENRELLEEKGIEIKPINHMNVAQFIKTYCKQLNANPPVGLAKVSAITLDVQDKVRNLIATIESELEKIRKTDGPVSPENQNFFLGLVNQFNTSLVNIIAIQEKIQPALFGSVVNRVTSNLHTFIEDVQNSDGLSSDTKNYILDLITKKVLTDDLLAISEKAEGKIIK